MFQITLDSVIPLPLNQKPNIGDADIWCKNVQLKQSEYTAVIAPSGTGKTTLIHTIYGLRKDYQGNILINNENVRSINEETIATIRSTKMSVIFQDMRLFPELTLWDNLCIKNNLTNFINEAELEQWISRLGLKNKKSAFANTLSYGEQQRVAIIRALLQPFSYLLMDEPFSHLDNKNKELACELILEIVQRNNAGILLADLDPNQYFLYHKTLML